MTEKESKNFIEQLIASFPDGDKPLYRFRVSITEELVSDRASL
jgi:hypothetical protein